MTKTLEQRLSQVLQIVQKLETSKGKIVQIRAINNKQSRTEANLLLLQKCVVTLERATAEPSPVPLAPSNVLDGQISSMRNKLCVLHSNCVDSKARSQRDNLLLFDVPDLGDKTWAESKNHVLRFCTTNLETPVVGSSIERALTN